VTAVNYRSMMSASDAIIWHIEDDPHLRSTIMAVWELDGEPAADRMADSLQRMVTAIPRLRQRVEPGRPRPQWAEVDDLAVGHHFHEHDLSGRGTFGDVQRLAERLLREPFDRTRPLWSLTLVRGLAGHRAAIIIKVHHAIADGIGLVLMLAAFTDLEPHPQRRVEPDNVTSLHLPRSTWSPLRRASHRATQSARRALAAPRVATRQSAATVASALRLVWPSRTPHSPRMTARSGRFLLDTRTLDFRSFRDAGKPVGATLNDVFVTIVVDALARYHAAFSRNPSKLERVRVHMPVDVRAGRTATVAGNEFVPARVTIEIPIGTPRVRLAAIRSRLAELQDEPALRHINTVAACVLRLGKRPAQWILGGMMKGVDVLASNVPGPNFPLYVAGAKVERFHAFGPPAGAALNITLFSYDGTVNLGITTDEAAVTDRLLFLRCLDDAIDAVVDNRRTALSA
jgi:WS/DGAT/MGAT family acyltransferase